MKVKFSAESKVASFQEGRHRALSETNGAICGNADKIEFEAEFNSSKTSKAIYDKLPIESTVDTWGDEIYFDIGLKLLNERPTISVKVGDIAYWAKGQSMCVFFGPTPISKDKTPKPASEVNIIGRTDCPPEVLKNIKAGARIRIDRA
jgi:hypothetical protein